MNQLAGKIKFGVKTEAIRRNDKNFENGHVALSVDRIRCFRSGYPEIYYNEKTRTLSSMIGYISNIEEVAAKYCLPFSSDLILIDNLYSSLNRSVNRLAATIDGIFIVVIFDFEKSKGYLLQPEFGSGLPLYYCRGQNSLFFNTSLKKILKEFSQKRELEKSAVKDFFAAGQTIPNHLTLVKDVFKSLPGTIMEIDLKNGVIRTQPHSGVRVAIRTIQARTGLIDSIRKNTAALTEQLRVENFMTTLTGGWDTNLMLFLLKKMTGGKIQCLSITGGINDELKQVKSILAGYRNIQLIHDRVDKDILDLLPDIVWKYEGYVFEEGMFLRYILARTAQKQNSNAIFLGAGADQILWPDSLLRRIALFIFGKYVTGISPTVKRIFVDYDIEIDYLLKMHDLVLNSYGIQGIYPFVNEETLSISRRMKTINNIKKRFYRKQVLDLLPREVTTQLRKSSKLVDTGQLFRKNMEILMRITQSDFIKEICPDYLLRKILKRPGKHHLLVIQLVFLYLFHRLFITGEFDSHFDEVDLITGMKELLN